MKAKAISLGCRPMPQGCGKLQKTGQDRSAKLFTRQVPASPQYLGNFGQKVLLVVHALIMNAQSMAAQARRNADREAQYDREEFKHLIRRLMTQRLLAEEVLNDEFDQDEFDCEREDLRQFLKNLCRETESVVLAGQAKHARAAGDEEIAARVERFLA